MPLIQAQVGTSIRVVRRKNCKYREKILDKRRDATLIWVICAARRLAMPIVAPPCGVDMARCRAMFACCHRTISSRRKRQRSLLAVRFPHTSVGVRLMLPAHETSHAAAAFRRNVRGS